MKYDKKFLVIGSKNAITYKEIYPLIRDNQLWLGYGFNNGNAFFGVNSKNKDKYAEGVYDPGTGLVKFRNINWYTNLDHKKRHEELPLYKKYTPEEYPKYDNYDAINVNKTAEIPEDYDGVMGVPITFLDKYCPEQFDIVAFRKGKDGKDLVFTREREREYNRTSAFSYVDCGDDKKCGGQNQRPDYLRSNNNPSQEPIDRDYPLTSSLRSSTTKYDRAYLRGQRLYYRIFIKRKP